MYRFILFFFISLFFIFPLLAQTKEKIEKDKPQKRPDNVFDLGIERTPLSNYEQNNFFFNSRFKTLSLEKFQIFFQIRLEYLQTEDKIGYYPQKLYQFTFSNRFETPNLFFSEIGLVERSDKPFENSNTLQLFTYTYYNFFPQENGGLYLGVIYFPFEKMFPDWLWFKKVPFPFFAYQYATNDFVLYASIPFMIRWKINSLFTFSLFYLPVYNIRSELQFTPSPFLMIGIEGNWRQKSFYLSDRENEREKIYLDTKKISLKMRIFFFLECALGYTFDNKYYKGESVSDINQEIKLKDGFFYTLVLKYAF